MRTVLVALALLTMSGCASWIDDAYDDHARTQCDQGSHDRSGCYDRVEQNRHERDRGD